MTEASHTAPTVRGFADDSGLAEFGGRSTRHNPPMTDRVMLRGGSCDGQIGEVDDASTGAATFWNQNGDEEWGDRHLVQGGETATDPDTGAEVPVFLFFGRVEAA
jgi:hypothetical protein